MQVNLHANRFIKGRKQAIDGKGREVDTVQRIVWSEDLLGDNVADVEVTQAQETIPKRGDGGIHSIAGFLVRQWWQVEHSRRFHLPSTLLPCMNLGLYVKRIAFILSSDQFYSQDSSGVHTPS